MYYHKPKREMVHSQWLDTLGEAIYQNIIAPLFYLLVILLVSLVSYGITAFILQLLSKL